MIPDIIANQGNACQGWRAWRMILSQKGWPEDVRSNRYRIVGPLLIA
jgi:hypothetical protein